MRLKAHSQLPPADDASDGEQSMLLTPKSFSLIALISSIFSLVYLWFRRGIFDAWAAIGFSPSSLVEGVRLNPGRSLDSDEQAQFAFIAASTHTLVVVLGMMLFTGTRLILSRYRAYRLPPAARAAPLAPASLLRDTLLGSSQARASHAATSSAPGDVDSGDNATEPLGSTTYTDGSGDVSVTDDDTSSPVAAAGSTVQSCLFRALGLNTTPSVARSARLRLAAEFVLSAVLGYGFYLALHGWFTFTFATRRGRMYLWARAFFYEQGGEKPFASCASLSYVLCLVSGYLIRLATLESRFSAWPRCARQWLLSIMAGFLGAYCLFRYLAIPFYVYYTHNLLARENDANPNAQFNPNFVALASATHTVAFVSGMLACFLSKRVWRLHAIVPQQRGLTPALLKFVTYGAWTALLAAAVIGGAVTSAHYVRVHWQESPIHLLSVSHVIWFAWGFLLLAGRVPTMVHFVLSVLLSPYHLTSENSGLRRLWRFCVVGLFYNLEKVTVVVLALSIIYGHRFPNMIMGFWTVTLLSYIPTYFGDPMHSGRRCLPQMRGHFVFQEMARYFRFRLHTDIKPGQLDPKHRYIFGFHPHGVIPISAGFLVSTPAWRRIFAGIDPAPLTSSIIHHVPLMRDFLHFMSGGDVTRRGFAITLNRCRSVVFVPGGQQEMIATSSRSTNDELCGSHKGFCRLAFELAAASKEPVHLVPMYNLGETKVLDNVQVPKRWQRLSVKLLRANIFFLPYGRWFLPGLPRPEAMNLIVGQPIEVPRIEKPTAEQVDLLHGRYFSSLLEAFERHKLAASGEKRTISIEPPLKPVSEKQWETACASFETAPRKDGRGLAQMFPAKSGDSLELAFTCTFWMTVFAFIFARCMAHAETFLLDAIFAS